MTRNLDVDRFRNGDLIPHIKSNEEWEKARENEQPAWCYNGNNPENGKKYGKLYNSFAVNDPRGLAPEGFHVPTDDEWTILVEFLGGKDIAGHKMKSVDGWEEQKDEDGELQNENGDNSSGFNGIPGGYRSDGGSFGIRYSAFFWSARKNNGLEWFRNLGFSYGNVYRDYNINDDKELGLSVRCLRDY